MVGVSLALLISRGRFIGTGDLALCAISLQFQTETLPAGDYHSQMPSLHLVSHLSMYYRRLESILKSKNPNFIKKKTTTNILIIVLPVRVSEKATFKALFKVTVKRFQLLFPAVWTQGMPAI